MTNEPTETPWTCWPAQPRGALWVARIAGQRQDVNTTTAEAIGLTEEEANANAALIVQACNGRRTLVQALRTARERLLGLHGMPVLAQEKWLNTATDAEACDIALKLAGAL